MTSRRIVLVALCVTQVVSWGVLYYALPVALAELTTDTGWSRTAVTAAFSLGLVVSAVAGIPVGRWLDAHGPRPVMTGGSVLAVVATVAIATAPTYALFLLSWVVAGLAMSAVLYQAAFAAVVGWWGPDRVRALTALTLVAGLSSTVFAPLTQQLLERLTWRETYLVLAAVLAVTVPLHALALQRPWASTQATVAAAPLGPLLRSRLFVVPCAALTVTAFGLFAVSLTLIPLLTGRGVSEGVAATALGLLGAGQLLGRLAYRPVAARFSPVGRTVLLVTASAASLGLLGALTGPAWALVAAAVLVGAVRGASTLLQATIVADLWGSERYGAVAGWFTAPLTLAAAIAPWGATAMAGIAPGGYPAVVLGLATALAVTAVVVAALTPRSPEPAAGRAAPPS